MQGRSVPSSAPPSAARGADCTMTEYRPLLLTRDFGLVWSGQLISQIGDGISKLALLWFVYSITGSPLKTSMIGLLQTIPPIVLGPVIGVYVDRLPKKVLLVGSDLLRALLIGLIPCLIPVESFTETVLYVLVLLHAHCDCGVRSGAHRRDTGHRVQTAIHRSQCAPAGHHESRHHLRSGAERTGDRGLWIAGSVVLNAATYVVSAGVSCWSVSTVLRRQGLPACGTVDDAAGSGRGTAL